MPAKPKRKKPAKDKGLAVSIPMERLNRRLDAFTYRRQSMQGIASAVAYRDKATRVWMVRVVFATGRVVRLPI